MSWDGQIFVTSYAQIERWWEMVMSVFAGQPPHKLLHQPQPQPSTQRDAQPQTIVFKLTQHDWNPAEGWKQALNNLRLVTASCKFASTLVESISIPRLSWVSLFNCVDESLPGSLPCHAPHPDFPFLLPRVTEERYNNQMTEKLMVILILSLMAGDRMENFLLEQQQLAERISILTEFIQTNPSARELKRALAVKLALQSTPYAKITTL